MNLRRSFLTMALSLTGLLVLIGGITWAALNAFNRTTELGHHRQNSLALMSETRHEVDLLGRLVNSFVGTADPRYLHYYYDILAIREGNKARPDGLTRTYWDNVIAGSKPHVLPPGGQAVSLLELTQKLKFDEHEQTIVSRILLLTENMKQIEQIAFAATQGLYDPEKDEFVSEASPRRDFANERLHRNDYLSLRAELAIAVEELSSLVDARTQRSLDQATQFLENWITASLAMLLLTILWLIYGYYSLRRNVLKPLTALHRTATALADKSYDERVGKIRGVDEIKTLAATIDGMAAAIEADIGQREVTQRELGEARARAEVATEAKSIFLANMSHEIRTPMNAILGMAYLALKSGLPARQHEQINKIHGSAKTLLGILNDILDFSKIEAGKISLENAPFNLEWVAGNALSMIQEQAGEKHLELIFDYRITHRPVSYLGDALRLGQVLINLLSNAVKFTTTGHVALQVDELVRTPEYASLRFSIQDTGIGMTLEQVERLFQEFSQADGSTTRKYGGTGLGLTISKRLVEAMGGEIAVDSVIDHGSSFSFILDLPLSPHGQHDSPSFSLNIQRALIVDDHPRARQSMARSLQQLGCQIVECAADGYEAVKKIRAGKEAGYAYDLMLLDWQMPESNGCWTLEKLRSEDLPVPKRSIVLSPQDPSLLCDEVARLGVFEVLQKPLLPEMLRPPTPCQASTGPSITPSPATAKPLAGMRILVVDDDNINRHIAEELLSDWGAEVVLDINGAAALKTLWGLPPNYFNLVLMDLEMPIMNGNVAAMRLRADPRFAELPILAMTAYAVGRELEQALREGMNGHIPKPFDPEQLLATLSRFAVPTGSLAPPNAVPAEEKSTLSLPSAILSLPGLDITALQRRFGGRGPFVTRMFQRFALEFANFSATFRKTLVDGDIESATRQTHSLKGLAGTLGLIHMQQLALAAETGLREGGSVDTNLENKISQELAEIISAIEQIERPVLPKSADFDHNETRNLLLRLRQLLSEADGESESLWTTHKTRFAGIFSPSELARAERAINNWNFDEALAVLSKSISGNEANT